MSPSFTATEPGNFVMEKQRCSTAARQLLAVAYKQGLACDLVPKVSSEASEGCGHATARSAECSSAGERSPHIGALAGGSLVEVAREIAQNVKRSPRPIKAPGEGGQAVGTAEESCEFDGRTHGASTAQEGIAVETPDSLGGEPVLDSADRASASKEVQEAGRTVFPLQKDESRKTPVPGQPTEHQANSFVNTEVLKSSILSPRIRCMLRRAFSA